MYALYTFPCICQFQCNPPATSDSYAYAMFNHEMKFWPERLAKRFQRALIELCHLTTKCTIYPQNTIVQLYIVLWLVLNWKDKWKAAWTRTVDRSTRKLNSGTLLYLYIFKAKDAINIINFLPSLRSKFSLLNLIKFKTLFIFCACMFH